MIERAERGAGAEGTARGDHEARLHAQEFDHVVRAGDEDAQGHDLEKVTMEVT